MRLNSIKTKLAALTLVCTVAPLIVVVANLNADAQRLVTAEALGRAEELAKGHAATVGGMLEARLAEASTLAQTFAGLNRNKVTSRKIYNDILRSFVEQNAGIAAAWSVWEPNAIDENDEAYTDAEGHDATGRYIPCFRRQGNAIELVPVAEYAKEGPQNGYLAARKSGAAVLREPWNVGANGGAKLHTGVVVPIKKGETMLGVIGLDLPVTPFRAQLAQITPYGTGFAALLSGGGIVVAHPDVPTVGTCLGAGEERAALEDCVGACVPTTNCGMLLGAREVSYTVLAPVKVTGIASPWALAIVAPKAKIEEPCRRAYANAVMVLVIAAALASLVGIFFSVVLVRPLRRAVDFARALARGEMTQRLAIRSKDEIGDLAVALESSARDLAAMLRRIKENAVALTTAAGSLSSVSGSLADGAHTMTDQTASVSRSTEEVSANVDSIASAANQVSASTQSVSSTAEEMSANMTSIARAVEDMDRSMQAIGKRAEDGATVAKAALQKAQSATEMMSVLGATAREIGQVTEVIKKIADQTNLLALNATIQAAAAGTAGKSFGVVADEVKDLARRCAQSAKDIGERIGNIRTSSEEAIGVIGDTAKVIGEIHEAVGGIATAIGQHTTLTRDIAVNVGQATTGVGSIAESIAQVAQVATTVAENAGKAATGARQVAASIQAVDTAVRSSGENAGSVRGSSEQLSNVAKELQTAVARFDVD